MGAFMNRSIGRLPHPLPGASHGERRRSVRHKLHSPVYASFNGPQGGMVVDLSELLDLHEDGFAVQTPERLETNRALTLCLEMPETKSYIHGAGQVIWSDDTGRGGIRFSGLSETSRKLLKEWLFANLLVACSNYSARMEQLARHEQQKWLDRSAIVSPLEAVRRDVREIGGNLDAALQLIAERALSLTGATGAALAFFTDGAMICRARAGAPAPPLGAPIDLRQGLSGECVLTGHLVSSADAENDPCVDPEVARVQGIRSLMAAPIVSDFRVLGLIEVFSPHPSAFTSDHAAVLHRLVEMIPEIHPENTQPETVSAVETAFAPSPEMNMIEPAAPDAGATTVAPSDVDSIRATVEAWREAAPELLGQLSQPAHSRIVSPELSQPLPNPAPTTPSRWYQRLLIWSAFAVVSFALGYLAGPLFNKYWVRAPQADQRSPAEVAANFPSKTSAGPAAQARPLPELQKLADRGDANAQWQMGVRYHNGEGVPQDDALAFHWFLRAAEQGNVDAQATLGAYCWAGRGVPQDLSKAYFWSAIALAQGDENSKYRLEGLSAQMTRDQVSAARQQAEIWINQHTSSTPAKN